MRLTSLEASLWQKMRVNLSGRVGRNRKLLSPARVGTEGRGGVQPQSRALDIPWPETSSPRLHRTRTLQLYRALCPCCTYQAGAAALPQTVPGRGHVGHIRVSRTHRLSTQTQSDHLCELFGNQEPTGPGESDKSESDCGRESKACFLHPHSTHTGTLWG